MVSPSVEREPFQAFLYVYVDDGGRGLPPSARCRWRLAGRAAGNDRRGPSAMVRDPFGNIFQIAHQLT